MADDRSLERRAKIYAFPQQFMVLRRNLTKFVSAMFHENIYQQTPSVRGVYFTSGTQEGRPFNLLMNRLAEAMGIRRKVEPEEAGRRSEELLPARRVHAGDLRGPRGRVGQRSRAQAPPRAAPAGDRPCSGCARSRSASIPSYAWSLNKLQLSRLESRGRGVGSAGAEEVERQAKARAARAAARAGQPPDRVRAVAARRCRCAWACTRPASSCIRCAATTPNLLRRELVQPMVSHDVEAMTDFGFRYESLPRARPTPEEHARFYDALKLHLFLTQPKGNGEPAFEKPQQDWVNAQLLGALLARRRARTRRCSTRPRPTRDAVPGVHDRVPRPGVHARQGSRAARARRAQPRAGHATRARPLDRGGRVRGLRAHARAPGRRDQRDPRPGPGARCVHAARLGKHRARSDDARDPGRRRRAVGARPGRDAKKRSRQQRELQLEQLRSGVLQGATSRSGRTSCTACAWRRRPITKPRSSCCASSRAARRRRSRC